MLCISRLAGLDEGDLKYFCENFIFANSIRRRTNSILRLGNDLPKSVNDRVILLFCKGFSFAKKSPCEMSRRSSSDKAYIFRR